jgi:tripartite-type tricarboxylate transporter receptor subunit TctC
VPLVPNVQAIGETKYPGAYSDNWYGITVPKGTPPEIVKKLHDAVVTVLKQPGTEKRINALGFVVIADSPENMARVIREEITEMKGLIQTGIFKIQ